MGLTCKVVVGDVIVVSWVHVEMVQSKKIVVEDVLSPR
jgi:hypothetical protein